MFVNSPKLRVARYLLENEYELGQTRGTGVLGYSLAQLMRNGHKYQIKEQLEARWNAFRVFAMSLGIS